MSKVGICFDFSCEKSLKDFDTFIASRSYIVGFSPSQSDVTVFTGLGRQPDASKFSNAARYYRHIASFSDDARAKFASGLCCIKCCDVCTKTCSESSKTCSDSSKTCSDSSKKCADSAKPCAAKSADPPKAATGAGGDDSGDDDLFGDDSDGEEAAKAIAAKAKKSDKPHKAAPAEKCQVVYEVKPNEAGQDMKEMEDRIRAIVRPGLLWGVEFRVVDVAFGIQKLVIQAVIESEKVDLQDIEDDITAFEDIVQSVDLMTMNRV